MRDLTSDELSRIAGGAAGPKDPVVVTCCALSDTPATCVKVFTTADDVRFACPSQKPYVLRVDPG